MKSTFFLYTSIVLALGACMFSVTNHDAHLQKDVRSLEKSPEESKLGDILTISPETNKNWVSAEYGVIINFVVKNNTDQNLSYYTANNFPEFNFAVTDEKHKEVPLTRYGNLLLNSNVQTSADSRGTRVSYSGIMLKPGEEHTNKILLSQLYDMSVPGKYFIIASRNVGIGAKSHLITSNTLEIEIDAYNYGQPTSKDVEYLRKQREEQVKEQDKKNNETNSHQ